MDRAYNTARWLVAFLAAFVLNYALAVDYTCKHDLSKLTGVVEKYSPAKARLVTPTKEAQARSKEAALHLGKWIPGLTRIMEPGLPYLLVENAAALTVAIHRDGDRVVLVSIFFPVVDIPSDQRDRSFQALEDIVGACVGAYPDTRTWLTAALNESWKIVAAHIDRTERTSYDRVVQDVFAGTRLAVWGVPPDMWQIFVMP